jgi:hypothetical protein
MPEAVNSPLPSTTEQGISPNQWSSTKISMELYLNIPVWVEDGQKDGEDGRQRDQRKVHI